MKAFTEEITSLLDEESLEWEMADKHDGVIVCHRATDGKKVRIGTVDFPDNCMDTDTTVIHPLAVAHDRFQSADDVAAVNDGGYETIWIVRDRWQRQASMMRKRLLSHLGIYGQIYARNCEIRRIDKAGAADFLQQYHSYGDASCRYRYGMFLKRHTGHVAEKATLLPGTLVAVAEFSGARRWKKEDRIISSYEWTRYASLPGFRISGGMGRMLRTFIDAVNPDDIMSYADLEWSDGDVYGKLGFVCEALKGPVAFDINTVSWNRTAVRGTDTNSREGHIRYISPGSKKYRLKLTDYR